MSDLNDPDPVVELADRMRAKQLRGENTDLELEIDFHSFNATEQAEFIALMNGRKAHAQDKLEGLAENVRILLALDALLEAKAPSGLTLWEAGEAGYITVLDLVEAIRSIVLDADDHPQPDPTTEEDR